LTIVTDGSAETRESARVRGQENNEIESKEGETKVGRYFVPATDIHETDTQLSVLVEMPGVDKGNIDMKLEKIR